MSVNYTYNILHYNMSVSIDRCTCWKLSIKCYTTTTRLVLDMRAWRISRAPPKWNMPYNWTVIAPILCDIFICIFTLKASSRSPLRNRCHMVVAAKTHSLTYHFRQWFRLSRALSLVVVSSYNFFFSFPSTISAKLSLARNRVPWILVENLGKMRSTIDNINLLSGA